MGHLIAGRHSRDACPPHPETPAFIPLRSAAYARPDLIATDSHIDSHIGGIDNSIDRD
jgi:hypothetical protein